jgi:chromosome segregation ATPase
MKRLLIFLIMIAVPAVPVIRADDDAAAQIAQARANEQRVRDSLRNVTQQLRTAEAEKATALAGLTERDEKIAALEKQVAALTKRSSEDKTDADKTIGRLQASLETQKQESARLATSLEKWKAGYQKLSGLAEKTEAARARLDAANIALERKAADRERQNLELYKTAREILQRYADFSTGRALAAREPFTGIAKARLEEQIQDYADKLEDNKLKPVPSDGKPSTKPVPEQP